MREIINKVVRRLSSIKRKNIYNVKNILLNGTDLIGVFIPNWLIVILVIGIIAAALPKEDKR